MISGVVTEGQSKTLHLLFIVDCQVSRQQGVVAMSALRHEVGVEVRVLLRAKSEVEVLQCLVIARLVRRPLGAVDDLVVEVLAVAVVV